MIPLPSPPSRRSLEGAAAIGASQIGRWVCRDRVDQFCELSASYGTEPGQAPLPPWGTLALQPGPRFQQIGDGDRDSDGGEFPIPGKSGTGAGERPRPRANRGRTPRPRPRTNRRRGRGRGRGPGCPRPGCQCRSHPGRDRRTVTPLSGRAVNRLAGGSSKFPGDCDSA
jgi:hypothetical protein